MRGVVHNHKQSVAGPQFYMSCLGAAGAVMLVEILSPWGSFNRYRLLYFAALALVAAAFRFRIPQTRERDSLVLPVALLSMAYFSLPAAMALGCLGLLAHAVWSNGRVVLHVGAGALALLFAYQTVQWAAGVNKALGLSVAGILLFATNSALFAGEASVREKRPFRECLGVWVKSTVLRQCAEIAAVVMVTWALA